MLILDDEENELILPKAEQIPSDFYRKGRHDQGDRQIGGDEQQPAPHHSFAYGQPVPERPFEQEVPEDLLTA